MVRMAVFGMAFFGLVPGFLYLNLGAAAGNVKNHRCEYLTGNGYAALEHQGKALVLAPFIQCTIMEHLPFLLSVTPPPWLSP